MAYPPKLSELSPGSLKSLADALESKQPPVAMPGPAELSDEQKRLDLMYRLGRRSIVEEVIAALRIKEKTDGATG